MTPHPPPSAQERIGILAGGGQFPALVAKYAREAGMFVAAAGFVGQTDETLADVVNAWTLLHIGQLGKLLDFFTANEVEAVVFAGAIDKPRALDIRPDFRAAKVLWKLRGKGDDALLRGVINELETEGFAVRQAADIVPGLRAPKGVCSKRPPTEEERDDLALAWSVAQELGRLDIGQCVVVKRGIVAAVEALEGTDETLARGARLAGPGCVALKRSKPGQDRRVDLPAIGYSTIQTLVEHKFSCLGYEAGDTLFFDQERSLELAARNKLAIVGLVSEDVPPAHLP